MALGKFEGPYELKGLRFGRLTAREDSRTKKGKVRCDCDCGATTLVQAFKLLNSHTKSCGCLRRDAASEVGKISGEQSGRFRHGMRGTPEYLAWAGMIQRCTNPNNSKWEHYGGRGIKVCERWYDFVNFYADMGSRPGGLTLDRINNEGNYEPENCRWATVGEQNANRRQLSVRVPQRDSETGRFLPEKNK